MSQQRGVLGTAAKESPRLFSCVLVSALATAQSVAFNSVSSLASTVAGEVLFLARRFFVLSIIFFWSVRRVPSFPFFGRRPCCRRGCLPLFVFGVVFFLPSCTEFPAAGQDWVLFT